MELKFEIDPVKNLLDEKIQHKIDILTKPQGSLGRLEKLALQICRVQNTLAPELKKPTIVVCAGDHGIANEGVSPFPQEVTFQMVMNFLAGGAGINVFAKQNGIHVKVVDAGVNYDFEKLKGLVDKKVAMGTNSYLNEAAMSAEECMTAITNGADIVKDLSNEGCNIIGFGEMGIGNTSSAAIILSKIVGIPIEEAVGRGAGVDDAGLKKKIELLSQAVKNGTETKDPLTILQHFGGFEIATIVGGMLQAAEEKMIILVDGFIASSAFLVAHKINNNIKDYAVFCHKSNEQAHIKMINYIGAEPLLDLGLRLGEGTGAAIAYPIIKSAVNMINEMASFESANVSNKN